MTPRTGWSEFRPHEEDLDKVLGKLEADILKALWKLGASSVREIHKEAAQHRDVALTTVATVLDRLFEKGLVERELVRTRGLWYEYRPALTKVELEKAVVKDVITGLFETFGDATVSHFINSAGIKDKHKIREFKGFLERLRREQE